MTWTLLGFVGVQVFILFLLQVFAPVNKQTQRPNAIYVAKSGDGAGDLYPWRTSRPRLSQDNFFVLDLQNIFQTADYKLEDILEKKAKVPQLYLSTLPRNLASVKETQERKSLFFRTLLPLVLAVNTRLEHEREKVLRLSHRLRMGQSVSIEDQIWLNATFEKYRTQEGDFQSLLIKLDRIPPSLVLAQAAEESGWGTSRFVREGNALFGQWTFNPKDKGIVPDGRATGKKHRIKAFDSLGESLADYVLNLNRHKAYREMRQIRTALKTKGKDVTGFELARGLTKYSQRGEGYVHSLHSIMKKNNLAAFDQAQLDQKPFPTDKIPAIWTSSGNAQLVQ